MSETNETLLLGSVEDRKKHWHLVEQASRIVVKIGTSSLVTSDRTFNLAVMKQLAYELEVLKKRGREIILVTSGAVVAGINALDLEERPRDVVELQVLASVGNPKLMEVYSRFFTEYPLAQILLTQENLSNRASFNHFREAIEKMMEMNVIPVINENDVVSVDELTHPEGVEFNFSDNDVLSALVAASMRADLLLVLSDTDGLYTKHPNSKFAEFIPLVFQVTPEIKHMGQAGGKMGRGGMASKIYAAEIVTRAGGCALICEAKGTQISNLFAGEPEGTLFLPKESLSDKKLWILFASSPRGRLVVDEGAKRALNKGASLLVKGITAVTGKFSKGDVVSIRDTAGKVVGNGIVNYSCREIERIIAMPPEIQAEFLKLMEIKEIVSSKKMTFL